MTLAIPRLLIPVDRTTVASERTLKRRRDTLHVIITGRYASQELIDCADLVTEMKLIKHPYEDRGIKAQQGIEF